MTTVESANAVAPTAPSEVSSPLANLPRIASVLGPTTVLTALLFYFGWVWTDAESRYLGLDESLLGFSTADYLLRSISTVFLPLIIVLLIGLLAHWLHGETMRRLEAATERTRFLARVAIGGLSAALLVAAVSTAWFGSDSGNNLFTPLAFAAGTALALATTRIEPGSRRSSASLVRGTLALLIVAACVFWEVSIYASDRGTEAGEALVASLSCRPDAALFSAQRLQLDAPGVTEVAVSSTLYRYDGLKLLLHTNGRYFLLPASWSVDNAQTVVVSDDKAALIELHRAC